jgi:hypothetical protein
VTNKFSSKIAKSKTFSESDQIEFSRLSRDTNPIHLDPQVARRTEFSEVIVHGMHLLFWALDVCFSLRPVSKSSLANITADFIEPVRLNQEIRLLGNIDYPTVDITILQENNLEAARFAFHFRETDGHITFSQYGDRPSFLETNSAFSDQPLTLSYSEVTRNQGTVDVSLNLEHTTRLFPYVAKSGFHPNQAAQLICLTYLVGMRCPGLHSVFSGLTISFHESSRSQQLLHYRVSSFDARFSSLVIEIESGSLSGEVRAFHRPRFQQQISFSDAGKLIHPNEFKTRSAVILGGSRGLGELTAKLLAAGAAKVHFSFNTGRIEAEAIASEISEGGGHATPFHYMIDSSVESFKLPLGFPKMPLDLFFFASPPIYKAKFESLSSELFARYLNFYCVSLISFIEMLQTHNISIRAVFFPSTSFLDDDNNPYLEYCLAKRAGEETIKYLSKIHPNIFFAAPRLPPLLTDQTSAIPQSLVKPGAPFILDILRLMG